MNLTRLQDRIDKEEDGSEVVVKRYGLWGTNVEIEVKNRKTEVVYPKGKREHFPTLGDAELRLQEIVAKGGTP